MILLFPTRFYVQEITNINSIYIRLALMSTVWWQLPYKCCLQAVQVVQVGYKNNKDMFVSHWIIIVKRNKYLQYTRMIFYSYYAIYHHKYTRNISCLCINWVATKSWFRSNCRERIHRSGHNIQEHGRGGEASGCGLPVGLWWIGLLPLLVRRLPRHPLCALQPPILPWLRHHGHDRLHLRQRGRCVPRLQHSA